MYRVLSIGLMAVVALAAAPRVAQAQPPVSYTFKIFNQGAPNPVSTTVLPAAGFVCNQTPKLVVPPGPVSNVKKLAIDDPANSLADCIFTDAGAGPLLALPFGTQIYTATLNAVYPAGNSTDTPSANSFTRPGIVGPAPAGFRVGQ